MLTDLRHYSGPHGSIRRKLSEIKQETRGLARRERQHSRFDDSGSQALADERGDIYKRIAYMSDQLAGLLEDIESHVRRYPHGGATS